MGAILLESVEGLGDSSLVAGAGEIWESLQTEREEVGRNLLMEATLCATNGGSSPESDTSEEYMREIACIECGDEIDGKRLTADLAACRRVGCQQSVEGEDVLYERSKQL